MSWMETYQLALRQAGIQDGSQRVTDPEQVADLLDIVNKSLNETARRSNTLSKTFSAERIAQLRADVDASKALASAYTDLEAVAGRDRAAYMAAFSRVESAVVSAEGRLASARAANDPAALQYMQQAYSAAGGGAAGAAAAWAELTGYISTQGRAMSDSQVLATMYAFDSINPDFMDERAFAAGRFDDALAPAGNLASAIRVQAKNFMGRAALAGQQQDAAERILRQAQGHVQGAINTLRSNQTLTTGQLDALRGPALQGLQALQNNDYFSAEDAAGQLRLYESEDRTLKQMEDFRELVLSRIGASGGADDDMARYMTTPGFRQWAEDRGFEIGTADANGRYLPGKHDMRAILAFGREFRRGSKEYDQVFKPHQTGDVIRVRTGEVAAPLPLLVAGMTAGADGGAVVTHYYEAGSNTLFERDAAGALVAVDPSVDPAAYSERVEKAKAAGAHVLTADGRVATRDDLSAPGVQTSTTRDPEVVKRAIERTPPQPVYVTTERLRTSARDLATQGSMIAYTDPQTGEVRLADPADVEVLRSGDPGTMRADAANLRRGEGAAEAKATGAEVLRDPVEPREAAGETPGGMTVRESAVDATATQQQRADAIEADPSRAVPPVRPLEGVEGAGADLGDERGLTGTDAMAVYQKDKRTAELTRQALVDARYARERKDADAPSDADYAALEEAARLAQANARASRLRLEADQTGTAGAVVPDVAPREPLPTPVVAAGQAGADAIAEDERREIAATGEEVARPTPALDAVTTSVSGEDKRPDVVVVQGRYVVRYDPESRSFERMALPAGVTAPSAIKGIEARQFLAGLTEPLGEPTALEPPESMRQAFLRFAYPAGAGGASVDVATPAASPEPAIRAQRANLDTLPNAGWITLEDGEDLRVVPVADIRPYQSLDAETLRAQTASMFAGQPRRGEVGRPTTVKRSVFESRYGAMPDPAPDALSAPDDRPVRVSLVTSDGGSFLATFDPGRKVYRMVPVDEEDIRTMPDPATTGREALGVWVTARGLDQRETLEMAADQFEADSPEIVQQMWAGSPKPAVTEGPKPVPAPEPVAEPVAPVEPVVDSLPAPPVVKPPEPIVPTEPPVETAGAPIGADEPADEVEADGPAVTGSIETETPTPRRGLFSRAKEAIRGRSQSR